LEEGDVLMSFDISQEAETEARSVEDVTDRWGSEDR